MEWCEVSQNASRLFSCIPSLFERYEDLNSEFGGNEIIYAHSLKYEMGRSKAKLDTEMPHRCWMTGREHPGGGRVWVCVYTTLSCLLTASCCWQQSFTKVWASGADAWHQSTGMISHHWNIFKRWSLLLELLIGTY